MTFSIGPTAAFPRHCAVTDNVGPFLTLTLPIASVMGLSAARWSVFDCGQS